MMFDKILLDEDEHGTPRSVQIGLLDFAWLREDFVSGVFEPNVSIDKTHNIAVPIFKSFSNGCRMLIVNSKLDENSSVE